MNAREGAVGASGPVPFPVPIPTVSGVRDRRKSYIPPPAGFYRHGTRGEPHGTLYPSALKGSWSANHRSMVYERYRRCRLAAAMAGAGVQWMLGFTLPLYGRQPRLLAALRRAARRAAGAGPPSATARGGGEPQRGTLSRAPSRRNTARLENLSRLFHREYGGASSAPWLGQGTGNLHCPSFSLQLPPRPGAT